MGRAVVQDPTNILQAQEACFLGVVTNALRQWLSRFDAGGCRIDKDYNNDRFYALLTALVGALMSYLKGAHHCGAHREDCGTGGSFWSRLGQWSAEVGETIWFRCCSIGMLGGRGLALRPAADDFDFDDRFARNAFQFAESALLFLQALYAPRPPPGSDESPAGALSRCNLSLVPCDVLLRWFSSSPESHTTHTRKAPLVSRTLGGLVFDAIKQSSLPTLMKSNQLQRAVGEDRSKVNLFQLIFLVNPEVTEQVMTGVEALIKGRCTTGEGHEYDGDTAAVPGGGGTTSAAAKKSKPGSKHDSKPGSTHQCCHTCRGKAGKACVCGLAYFCCVDCQRKGWKEHKAECKAARGIVSGGKTVEKKKEKKKKKKETKKEKKGE